MKKSKKIFECLIGKTYGFKTNPGNSFTTKAGEQTSSGFWMSTISSFKSIENDYHVCRCKDCMKKFCKSLRENTMKVNNFKKKNNKVINKWATENVENKYLKDKNIVKLEIIAIIQRNIQVLCIAYVV